MTGRQIGYAAAGVLALVVAYRVIARPTPNTGPIPAPAPSGSVRAPAPSASFAVCDRGCGQGRIYKLALTCDEHPELDCKADATIALAAYAAGRCDDAKNATLRAASAVQSHAADPKNDTPLLAYAELAKLGVDACVPAGDASK